MRLLFAVLGDEDRGSTRYRVYNMLPFLEDAGIDADVLSLVEPRHLSGPEPVRKAKFGLRVGLFAARLLLVAPRYDAVYLQKIPPNPAYARLLGLVADELVYDFDDALYTTKPWEDEDVETWADNLRPTLRAADTVVVGSEPLAAYAEQYADEVHVLPVSLPYEPYEKKRSDGPPDDDYVTIGWIGYPENLRYLETVADAIAEVLDAHEEARLHVITGTECPVEPLADRPDVEYLEWSLEAQMDYLAAADVGIRPVSDDEWTRAKNFVSTLQFMALGRPIVVSPVGLLTEFVTHGTSGFHAETDAEWVEALETLIEDESRRREMGDAALESVEAHGFWRDQRAAELVSVLESLPE